MASSSSRRPARLLPALAAALLQLRARAVDAHVGIDEALLTDLLAGYATHVPTDCNATPALAGRTTFSFSYPGVNAESMWNPDAEGFEEALFSAWMKHEDANGHDWEIRVGTGGNVYSAFARGMEAMAPQAQEGSPWVDEVDQIVSVNNQLNSATRLDHDLCDYASGNCQKYFIHQAGAYQRDSPYTSHPFHSPSLARHCAGNACAFASWGTQAHVPTPFQSPVIYLTRFANCGDGVIEHTQMIHNFADPATSDPLEVDQDYFNVGWGGVRTTSYPYALEPNSAGALSVGHADDVNSVDYLPLCRWGVDAEGTSGPAGRAAMKNINSLGGYTTFVGDGLIVNRTTPELRTACRKPNTTCRRNTGSCMVDVCTAEMVENDGYVPIQLGVRRGGANCDIYNPSNPYGGYVALKCNFRLNTGFGKSRPYLSDPDPCAPWRGSRIGFRNTLTGATLEVSQVRHWSWRDRDYTVYFLTFFENTGEASQWAAVNYVNSMFKGASTEYEIELRTVYMSPVKPWCRKPNVACDTDPTTCMVPSCTDFMIEKGGYTRIALGVPPQGPDCQFYNTTAAYQGLVTLQCNLRLSDGFGRTDVDGDHPPIGLWNTVNGKTLEVPNVKHWAINHDDHRVYFSVNFVDDGEGGSNRNLAINHVNEMFANPLNATIPIEIRSLSTSGLEGEVPASYDPAPLPAFTYVYGKGEVHNSGAVSGWSRRRIGSTANTRQYTVFTINWLGSARLRAGETYVNRGFKFTSDLGSVQATASDLTSKVYIDEVGLEQWSPRKIDIYQDDSRFAVIAATEAEGVSTSCPAISSPPVCSGTSTPKSGHSPFFHVTCGAESYLGPNPYHFTPPFDYCIRVQTGADIEDQGYVVVLVNSNDGKGYVEVTPEDTYYSANEVVYDHCFVDLVGVQVKPDSTDNWLGTVKVSTDHKVSYSSLPCDNCSGEKNIVESIVVDYDDSHLNASSTSCQSWTDVCTMPVRHPYCVIVQTSNIRYSDGPLDVWVDSGYGYTAVASGDYGRNNLILDECYPQLLGVRVRNPSTDSWMGDILVSTDNKMTYTPMTCDDCTSQVTHASPIIVNGNEVDSTATTECIGKNCTLTYEQTCVRVTTGSTPDSSGNLDVFVNSGDGRGFFKISSDKYYTTNETVVHQCFANLVAIQVKGISDDAWQGSIEASYDGQPFSPLVVNEEEGWEGTTNTTDSIVVSSGSSNDLATTKCLNGNICTLPIRSLCLLITTGDKRYNWGAAAFYVDSGNGYVQVGSGYHKRREIVVDQCFHHIVGIKVQGQVHSRQDSWVGSILLSSNNKESYHALECQGCTGTESTTSMMVIDADDVLDSTASTQCINGNECEIFVHAHPTGGKVRSYACEYEGVSVRPSWKLMGFFDSSEPGCAGLSTSSYDESACTPNQFQ